MGRRHVELLQRYAGLIGRVSKSLHDDCVQFRPVHGAYSPYGVLYGFSADLMKHMVLKASQPDAVAHFSLEDVFVGGGADKLAWVTGWRKLPHLKPEIARQFDYPQQFADDVFERIEEALRRRAGEGETSVAVRTGHLFIALEDDVEADSKASTVSDLPARYVASSDMQLVAANRAVSCDETRVRSDWREGKCLVSYQTARGCVAITKDVLTELLAAGRDVRVAALPEGAAAVLKLMCPGLIRDS
jgi:hypothetical protein